MAIEFEIIYWNGQWEDDMWTLGMWPYISRTTGDSGYCVEFPNTMLIETKSLITDLIETIDMDLDLIENKSIMTNLLDVSEIETNLIENIMVDGAYCGE